MLKNKREVSIFATPFEPECSSLALHHECWQSHIGVQWVFFITFTCARWMPLFAITNGYHAVYKWFDYLKEKGHYIIGYVIMPDHVHAVIAFSKTTTSINTMIGNGKRFMAYELVKLLTAHTRQKIHYIHQNPCKDKRIAARLPEDYVHSSATYYYTGGQGIYPVMTYMELQDIALE